MARWSVALGAPVADPKPHDDVEPPPRRRRRGWVTVVLVLFGLGFAAFGVVRVASLDGRHDNEFVIGAIALTPYVTAGCFLLVLVMFLLRRRILAVFTLVVALALGTLLLPRYLSEAQPDARGPHLRIMAANLYLGRADARTVVDLVKREKIDVLVLPELTPAAVGALERAGLSDALPHHVFDARVGGDGTGIAANVPLRKVILMPESLLAQPSAVVDLPGRADLEITAVHVQPPLSTVGARRWRAELAAMPAPRTEDRTRILAGDFNATLDHSVFRDLVDRGWSDAGEATGEGLRSTWSSLPSGPPLTIDHVLVDNRSAISGYSVHDLPGSDHDAVIAEVVLPK